MSEELLQRGLLDQPEKIGKWDFYNIGATTIKSLKQNGIIKNIDYKRFEARKPDALLVKNKVVIAVIENKRPSELNTVTKQKKAIKQGLDVAQILGAIFLVVTDTKKGIWLNVANGKPITDEDNSDIVFPFSSKDHVLPTLINKIISSINKSNSQLIPTKLHDPTSLAKQIWQDIWSVSGATPENCLYTFVELFIFKYLSDLSVLSGIYSFQNLLKQYDTNSEDEVLEFYADVIRKKIKTELFPGNTKDNTTIINGTIFVSKDDKAIAGYSTVFKKILLKFEKEGELKNIHHDFKSKIFESFLKESISKKNWGQFFTPLKVVRNIVKMASIKEGMVICDPACGVGKFLLEPILKQINKYYHIDENNKLISKIKLVGFDKGFDKDEQKTIILAKANMLIYFSDLIKNHTDITPQFAELFNNTFTLKTNSILGTLSDPIENEYDLILTNPPYVTSGSSNLKEEIKKSGLEYHYPINALGVESLFIEWIVKALKPSGQAFVVVPDGFLNRQNDKYLRKFVSDECFIDAIISLPAKTFFTTIKKTYILAITKKDTKSAIQSDPVFTYLVSDIGETLDVYRFDIDDNHLNEAVILFNQFKGAKQFFKTDDPRCKIQPFEKFQPESHWSIDRWWNHEEQITLGIAEQENIFNITDLNAYLEDFSNTINEYQEEVSILVSENSGDASKLLEISLNDSNYFETFIGKRILKKDIRNSQGDIPAYSANVFKPFGFISTSNITDTKHHYILWGIDGNFEFNVMEKGVKFATTDHCGAIKILAEDILPDFLLYQLNNVKIKYGFDRALRASLKNMKKVKFLMPIKEDGSFDVETQQKIASKQQIINEMKQELQNKTQQLLDTKIIFEK